MSEKRQARFEMLRETSKGRIENAALELFAQQGYGRTSISQIAKAAGISKGLMYNYYESKEALLHSILQKGFDFSESLFPEGIDSIKGDPGELLKHFIEATFYEVINNPNHWKLLSSLAFQEDVMQELAEDIEQKKQDHLELGIAIFQQLGHKKPKAMAYYFGATMDGIMLQYTLSTDDYPLEELKELLIDKFCKKIIR